MLRYFEEVNKLGKVRNMFTSQRGLCTECLSAASSLCNELSFVIQRAFQDILDLRVSVTSVQTSSCIELRDFQCAWAHVTDCTLKRVYLWISENSVCISLFVLVDCFFCCFHEHWLVRDVLWQFLCRWYHRNVKTKSRTSAWVKRTHYFTFSMGSCAKQTLAILFAKYEEPIALFRTINVAQKWVDKWSVDNTAGFCWKMCGFCRWFLSMLKTALVQSTNSETCMHEKVVHEHKLRRKRRSYIDLFAFADVSLLLPTEEKEKKCMIRQLQFLLKQNETKFRFSSDGKTFLLCPLGVCVQQESAGSVSWMFPVKDDKALPDSTVADNKFRWLYFLRKNFQCSILNAKLLGMELVIQFRLEFVDQNHMHWLIGSKQFQWFLTSNLVGRGEFVEEFFFLKESLKWGFIVMEGSNPTFLEFCCGCANIVDWLSIRGVEHLCIERIPLHESKLLFQSLFETITSFWQHKQWKCQLCSTWDLSRLDFSSRPSFDLQVCWWVTLFSLSEITVQIFIDHHVTSPLAKVQLLSDNRTGARLNCSQSSPLCQATPNAVETGKITSQLSCEAFTSFYSEGKNKFRWTVNPRDLQLNISTPQLTGKVVFRQFLDFGFHCTQRSLHRNLTSAFCSSLLGLS